MEKLTKTPIEFKQLGCTGHLYKGWYREGNIAITAGELGEIGQLSVNLVDYLDQIGEDEFFVRLYGQGLYMNEDCFRTGLFEKAGPEFTLGDLEAPFQKWRLKK